jgi:hypothetical protein
MEATSKGNYRRKPSMRQYDVIRKSLRTKVICEMS